MSEMNSPVKRARILLAGGSGFIGQALAPRLLEQGYEVVILSRSTRTDSRSGVRRRQWDGSTVGDWAEEVDGAAAVINLAGKSVNCRPTTANQREIVRSRIDSVNAIAQAIRRAAHPPGVWVQASSLAYYGDPGDTICDESSPAGDTFGAEVCRRWEAALAAAETPRTRKAAIRIGFALARGGGALGTLETLTRWFLGGRVGSGQQYISWLHMRDLENLFLEALRREDFNGPYNACTPTPVTNEQFMRELRQALHRPWSPPAPAWAVTLASIPMRTDPELALGGRRCVPKRLEEQGFTFEFTDLSKAMQNLYAEV